VLDGDFVKIYRGKKILIIWRCSLGVNLGVEADGKEEHFRRPVLILKAFNKVKEKIIKLIKEEKFQLS